MLRFLLGLAMAVVLLMPVSASAWIIPRRVEVVQYYAAPAPVVTSYYTAPAPVVTSYYYVAPAPVVTYAAPAAVTTYYYRAPLRPIYNPRPAPLLLYGP
jgi:hypothetical protein